MGSLLMARPLKRMLGLPAVLKLAPYAHGFLPWEANVALLSKSTVGLIHPNTSIRSDSGKVRKVWRTILLKYEINVPVVIQLIAVCVPLEIASSCLCNVFHT
jgi:hypothetical protein